MYSLQRHNANLYHWETMFALLTVRVTVSDSYRKKQSLMFPCQHPTKDDHLPLCVYSIHFQKCCFYHHLLLCH